MKKLLILFIFFAFANGFSQIKKPVKWMSKVEKIADNEYNLIITATIEKDWHVYSQFTPEGGSLPITLKYDNPKNAYKLIGKTTESPYKKHFNEVFEVEEYYFDDNLKLTQKVQILDKNLSKIKVNLDYQTCKDACINDNLDLSFNIPASEKITEKVKEVATTKKDSVKPETVLPIVTNKIVTAKIEPNNENNKSDKNSLWNIFLLAFFGGIIATFTPCVFPMIPMTVSFFLKQSANKTKGKFNAVFYGLCIIAICVVITIPFHILEGVSRDIFSEISTNVYLNIFFFLIFSLFAISFFGAFEITMPSKLSNKVDEASNKGGLIGIFFMALTLIVVSFSCIGPALGFVFGTSLNADGGAKVLSVAMFAFGLGLALPFMFFALMPSLLSNLPKSGGWLNTVKVVFGFIELALAFKFLSNADIGMDLHWLEREVFIAIWIAIFGGLALYLFGKITLPHDSPLSHISVGRLLLAIITLSFTIYLIPGLWGAPLKLISAFPPPSTYSESPQGFGGNHNTQTSTEQLPEGAVYGVHNLISFDDYQDGLAYAKKVKKPILIDFTGKQCVNCRLMENNVWSDEVVLKILKNEVVLISLYGDDKTELPENEQYISKETGNKISTIGQKVSEFQIQKYNNNSRPYYVLIDIAENKLNEPVPYTPDIKEYTTWLQDGISKFKR